MESSLGVFSDISNGELILCTNEIVDNVIKQGSNSTHYAVPLPNTGRKKIEFSFCQKTPRQKVNKRWIYLLGGWKFRQRVRIYDL